MAEAKNKAADALNVKPDSNDPNPDADHVKDETAPENPNYRVVRRAPAGRIIKAGEPVTVESSDVESDQLIVVKETVWQEFYPENSLRPSWRMLYVAGQTVNKAELEVKSELNKSAARPEVV